MNAPLALFVFNRPLHLRRTINSLKACEGFLERPIFVFSDGPRRAADEEMIGQTRSVISELLPNTVRLVEAETNKGLANSIVEGVDMITRDYGRVIVVEDDLEVAPGFFFYMDKVLDLYAEDERIMQVSGHMFDGPKFSGQRDVKLLPLTTTWGWGTWRRAWNLFDVTASAAESVLASSYIRNRFNFNGAVDYCSMLQEQIRGKRDSWGIRFYLSLFIEEKMGVFPPRTLVRNYGFDGSGSHGRGWIRGFNHKPKVNNSWPDPRQWKYSPVESDELEIKMVEEAIRTQNAGKLGSLIDFAKRRFSQLM